MLEWMKKCCLLQETWAIQTHNKRGHLKKRAQESILNPSGGLLANADFGVLAIWLMWKPHIDPQALFILPKYYVMGHMYWKGTHSNENNFEQLYLQ